MYERWVSAHRTQVRAIIIFHRSIESHSRRRLHVLKVKYMLSGSGGVGGGGFLRVRMRAAVAGDFRNHITVHTRHTTRHHTIRGGALPCAPARPSSIRV